MIRLIALIIFWYAVFKDEYYLFALSWIFWEIGGGFKASAVMWFSEIGNKIKNP
jgi:hypothetical protein